VSWRALIAVAALLLVGIPGAAPSTAAARRTSAPEFLAAHARTSGGAEIRRGRHGSHAPSATQPRAVGPVILPPHAPAARILRRAAARAPPCA
jgi:hypothetical protein